MKFYLFSYILYKKLTWMSYEHYTSRGVVKYGSSFLPSSYIPISPIFTATSSIPLPTYSKWIPNPIPPGYSIPVSIAQRLEIIPPSEYNIPYSPYTNIKNIPYNIQTATSVTKGIPVQNPTTISIPIRMPIKNPNIMTTTVPMHPSLIDPYRSKIPIAKTEITSLKKETEERLISERISYPITTITPEKPLAPELELDLNNFLKNFDLTSIEDNPKIIRVINVLTIPMQDPNILIIDYLVHYKSLDLKLLKPGSDIKVLFVENRIEDYFGPSFILQIVYTDERLTQRTESSVVDSTGTVVVNYRLYLQNSAISYTHTFLLTWKYISYRYDEPEYFTEKPSEDVKARNKAKKILLEKMIEFFQASKFNSEEYRLARRDLHYLEEVLSTISVDFPFLETQIVKQFSIQWA